MPINFFDQACRYAVKLDPIGFLCWLLRELPALLFFLGWLDTRTLPFPGDPERTCDTVACLGDPDPNVRWAMPIEFCLAPDGAMFGRLLVYLGQLWSEYRPTNGSSRYQVGAIVVNLTGRGDASRDMTFRQTRIRTCLGVEDCNLAGMDAAATLTAIAAGQVARCVLVWIPLMRGGGESAIMAQWRDLALAEPDAKRRADHGGLALVFAEAAGRREAWQQALEDWNVVQSQQVLEWQAQARAEGEARGRVEGKAETLLRILELRFGTVPTELGVHFRTTTSQQLLDRWVEAAVTVSSLEEFRRSIGA